MTKVQYVIYSKKNKNRYHSKLIFKLLLCKTYSLRAIDDFLF